jgi:hypothetical protein
VRDPAPLLWLLPASHNMKRVEIDDPHSLSLAQARTHLLMHSPYGVAWHVQVLEPLLAS